MSTDPNKSGNVAGEDEMVITPGGPRPRSLVHQMEPGHICRVKEGVWQIVNHEGTVVKEFKASPEGVTSQQAPASTSVMTRSIKARAGALNPEGFGTGWIGATFWDNDPNAQITSFSTTWVVPPPPETQSGQLVYLFNGLQGFSGTDLYILQPVLQWGVSPDGGGSSWSVASWLVGPPNVMATVSPLTAVNPGDTLVGVMQITGQVDGQFQYQCFFQDLANSVINMQFSVLNEAVETLEAYGITQCSDYPNTTKTAFSAINIQTSAGTPTVSWRPMTYFHACGQGVTVVDGSATNGEVDIFYSGQPASSEGRIAAVAAGVAGD